MKSIDEIFSHVAKLNSDDKQVFYHKFGFNLTISIRGVWHDPTFSDVEKIEMIKWINELSHRIFHWLWELKYAGGKEFDDLGCPGDVKHYGKLCRPAFGFMVAAVRESYHYVTSMRS